MRLFLGDLPDDRPVDPEVLVDRQVTERPDLPPRHVRVAVPEVFRQGARNLAEKQDAVEHRVAKHVVGVPALAGHPAPGTRGQLAARCRSGCGEVRVPHAAYRTCARRPAPDRGSPGAARLSPPGQPDGRKGAPDHPASRSTPLPRSLPGTRTYKRSTSLSGPASLPRNRAEDRQFGDAVLPAQLGEARAEVRLISSRFTAAPPLQSISRKVYMLQAAALGS